MQKQHPSTTAQVRADASKTWTHARTPDPAASPLRTDDEAAGTTPSADRVETAREAERKIDDAAKRSETLSASAKGADDSAQTQRGSSAPYAKEDHMNRELVERVRAGRSEENAS